MDKLVYWEIPTTDLEKTTAFFSALFGWKMEPTSDDYVMFQVEDGMGGGIQRVEKDPGHGVMAYVKVDDIPATLSRVQELGGKPLQPKTEIGNDWGYWASFQAPGCPLLGLWSQD